MIDGKLWHRVKAKLGSRNSRKRGSKGRKGIRPCSRIMKEYLEALNKK